MHACTTVIKSSQPASQPVTPTKDGRSENQFVRNKRHFACADALSCDDVNFDRDVMACIPDCGARRRRSRSIDQELVDSSRHEK